MLLLQAFVEEVLEVVGNKSVNPRRDRSANFR